MTTFPKTDDQLIKNIRDQYGDEKIRNGNATEFTDEFRPYLIDSLRSEMYRRGYPQHEIERAADMVDHFIGEEFLELLSPDKESVSVFETFDRSKGGRFHAFLRRKCVWRMLDNPASGRRRRKSKANAEADESSRGVASQQKPSIHEKSLDDDDAPQLPGGEPELTTQHERARAIVLLGEALVLYKAELLAKNEERRWRLFWKRYMEPSLTGSKRPTVQDVYHSCGYSKLGPAYYADKKFRDEFKGFLNAAIENRLAMDDDLQRLFSHCSKKQAKEIKERLIEEYRLDFDALMAKEAAYGRPNVCQRSGKWKGDSATEAISREDEARSDSDGTGVGVPADPKLISREDEARSDSDGTEMSPVDRGALQRYFRCVLEEHNDPHSDTPPMSSDVEGVPDVPRCGLHDIALLLSQDPANRDIDYLQEEFDEYFSRSWQKGVEWARRRKELKLLVRDARFSDLNVRDSIHHKNAPLDLLIGMKETAKALRKASEGEFENKVLVAVYYACAAAAIVKHGETIVDCETAKLARNFEWLAGQQWVDEYTRNLAKKAASAIS